MSGFGWAGGSAAIIQPELQPRHYGSKGNFAADTTAMQRMITDMVRTGRPGLLDARSGTLLLRSQNNTSPHDYRGAGETRPFFPALTIPAGFTLNGGGGTLKLGGTSSGAALAAGAFTPMFATTRNLELDAIENLIFNDVDVDLDSAVSGSVSNPYVLFASGVTNFQWNGGRIFNSTTLTRRGWALILLNCQEVALRSIRATRLNQFLNARYVYNGVLDDLDFDTVSECIDFDGVVKDFQIRALRARYPTVVVDSIVSVNPGSQQVLDLSSAVRVQVDNIIADGYASVVSIYDKQTTTATYAEYYAGNIAHEPPNYITSADVAVRGLLSTNSAFITPYEGNPNYPYFNQGGPFSVGIGREAAPSSTGRPSPKRISLENAQFYNAGTLRVSEGEVAYRRVLVDGVPRLLENGGFAALYAQRNVQDSQIAADTTLELSLDNFTVRNCSGAGIVVDRAQLATFRDVTVDGFNLEHSAVESSRYGLRVTNYDGKARPVVEFAGRIDIGGGGTGAISLYLNDTGSHTTNIGANAHLVLRDEMPLALGGAAAYSQFGFNEVLPESAADTIANAEVDVPLLPLLRGGKRLLTAHLVLSATLTPSANNPIYSIFRDRGGVLTYSTTGNLSAGVTAHVPFSLNLNESETDTTFQVGDKVFLRWTKDGSGVILPAYQLLLSTLAFDVE